MRGGASNVKISEIHGESENALAKCNIDIYLNNIEFTRSIFDDKQSVTINVKWNVNPAGTATTTTVTARYIEITLNTDPTIIRSGSQFSSPFLETFELTAKNKSEKITTIHVRAVVQGIAYAGLISSGAATADLNYTINIQDIAPSKNIVFLTGNNPNLFLRLSRFSEFQHQRIVIKSNRTAKNVWIFSDDGIVNTEIGKFADVNEHGFFFNDIGGCLILLKKQADGNSPYVFKWWILSYYSQ